MEGVRLTPQDIRRAFRVRQKAARKKVALLQHQALQRALAIPAVRRERTRQRLRRIGTALLLLLLLCLVRCECETVPPPQQPAKAPAVPVLKVAKPKPAPKKKTRPIAVKMVPQERGKYTAAGRASPSWIEDLRLQVAARSVRLAQCFTGADRPGVLRWTARVNPDSGAVSDHEIEPIPANAELGRDQKACVVGVLGTPSYRLHPAEIETLPDSVSLVIEF